MLCSGRVQGFEPIVAECVTFAGEGFPQTRPILSPSPAPWASRLAAVTIGLLGIAAGMLAPLPPRHLARRALSTPVAYVAAMVETRVKRKVYPYSIVPGGAANLREAKQAMTDPDVKANYADVDFAQLKQVKLTSNLSGYGLRIAGATIFLGPRTPSRSRAGETVFTDGTHIVRGRCLQLLLPPSHAADSPN